MRIGQDDLVGTRLFYLLLGSEAVGHLVENDVIVTVKAKATAARIIPQCFNISANKPSFEFLPINPLEAQCFSLQLHILAPGISIDFCGVNI